MRINNEIAFFDEAGHPGACSEGLALTIIITLVIVIPLASFIMSSVTPWAMFGVLSWAVFGVVWMLDLGHPYKRLDGDSLRLWRLYRKLPKELALSIPGDWTADAIKEMDDDTVDKLHSKLNTLRQTYDNHQRELNKGRYDDVIHGVEDLTNSYATGTKTLKELN